MHAALLPVKALGRAKGRLGLHFTDVERRAIAHALMLDALDLAESVAELQWWVLSDDDDVLEVARARGLTALRDPKGAGLNETIAGAIAEVARAGAASVLVVPSDVPLAEAEDLRDILDTGATSDVVVVPGRGGGTNGLWMAPPDLLAPSFGSGSLQTYVEAAERGNLRCSILPAPRMALDIDTLEDVHAFLTTAGRGGRTRSLLARLRPQPARASG